MTIHDVKLRLHSRRFVAKTLKSGAVAKRRMRVVSMPFEGSQSGRWGELVAESVPVAIVLTDPHRIITFANRHTEVLFGFSRTDLLNHPLEILIAPRWRDVPANPPVPESPRGGSGAPTVATDAIGVRKNGSTFPIEIYTTEISDDSGIFMLATIIDCTARLHAENVEQHMAALVESADDAIVTKTLDGVIRSWNPGAERLLGYTAREIVGQPVTCLIPSDRLDEETMIIDRIQRGERVTHFETLRRRKDGALTDVSLTISPIRNRHGKVIGASKIMRDISQRRRAEELLRTSNAELEQRNAELDEFVYTASHDLKSPLLGVSSVVSWMMADDSELTDEMRDRLKLIQRRVERMSRLLNDIRKYARAGRSTEQDGTTMSAAMLVAEIVDGCNVPPGFSIRSDPSLDTVRVVRAPLEQVLSNLIGNALKHHDQAGGSIIVAAERRGQQLHFSVADDGPGVPSEYCEVIFEMFKTLKPRDELEGSGMGLALVRKIVTRLGGRCGVDPLEPRGARFWFDWPNVAPSA